MVYIYLNMEHTRLTLIHLSSSTLYIHFGSLNQYLMRPIPILKKVTHFDLLSRPILNSPRWATHRVTKNSTTPPLWEPQHYLQSSSSSLRHYISFRQSALALFSSFLSLLGDAVSSCSLFIGAAFLCKSL